jgi:hypothetical protein
MFAAEDDTAVRDEPTRHVDYLSHDWKEEDIWKSWRYMVGKRKVYSNSARLENASWRPWTKAKYRLRTVSPETLTWLKDCDVTWLYGPLQTHSDKSLIGTPMSPAGSHLSKSNSFLNKKPILKKRSMSEIMLQRSLSSSSLVKQAAAAVQSQQADELLHRPRPGLGRAQSDFVGYAFTSKSSSKDTTSEVPSALSSGLQSPSVHGKHIHFNDRVEQCIAVDIKEMDEGDEEDEEEEDSHLDDEYSDEDVIMMKPSSRPRANTGLRKPNSSARSSRRGSLSEGSKTIAMLPATTLKYREDSSDRTTSSTMLQSMFGSGKLSPSPSQETLRPSKTSQNAAFMFDDEDNDDIDTAWDPSRQFARDSDSDYGSQTWTDDESATTSTLNDDQGGLRRTPSGLFMPLDEDEDEATTNGLFGRVVDTVNTARDIAHVIWNVGWRR